VKLTVERMPESQVRLAIAADESEFAEAMDKAYRKVSREATVPGFRRGKAPRHIIERLYGREVFLEEAHKGLMDDLYRKAVTEADIVPVGNPEVEFVSAEPLEFNVIVPVFPTVDAGDYTSVRVDSLDASIADTEIDAEIEVLRQENSPWVTVADARKPVMGDQVTVDLKLTGEDGEEIQAPIDDAVFVIGESQLFEGLRTTIEDLLVGESGQVTIAFDEDDEAAAERLRGKVITYDVTLKEVKVKSLLELNDEFAVEYGEVDTMEKLRESVLAELHARKTSDQYSSVVASIIQKIGEGASIELPAPMVDDGVEEELGRLRQRLAYQRTSLEAYLRLTGQTEEQFKETLRPSVSERLSSSLVMRKVAELEGIEVSDDDIEAAIAEFIAKSSTPDQMRRIYSEDRYLRSLLRNELFDKRLTDRLIEIATEGRGAVINPFVAPEPVLENVIDAASSVEGAPGESGEAPPVEEVVAESSDEAATGEAER
jgi:trigger factor